jgi:hypothetical protein
MFHSSEFIAIVWCYFVVFKIFEKYFYCPCVFTAREIGVNEDIRLKLGEASPWSDCSCWSYLMLLLFFHPHHLLCKSIPPSLPCPRVLTAWEISANEVVSLFVWSRPLLSR